MADIATYEKIGRKIRALSEAVAPHGIKISSNLTPTMNWGAGHPWRKFTFATGTVREFAVCPGDEGFRKEAEAYLATLPPIPYEHHPGQLEAMLTALETDGPVPITGEEGRRTIELITAIYKSGSLHQPVSLPLQKDDPFYTVDGIRSHVPHFYEKSASVEGFEGEIVVGGSQK